MIGIIIVAHNRIAGEMLAAAEHVLGHQSLVAILNVEDSDQPDLLHDQLADLIRRTDTGHGVFILADMFGGTPCNVAITTVEPGRIEVMSGFNLPSLIKAMSFRQQTRDLHELARTVRESGQQYIRLASDYLENQEGEPPHDPDGTADE